MKFAIIIPDGCADEAQVTLGNKTPLQVANTPTFDAIAKLGVVGRSNNVPDRFDPGSAVANMSLFGFDPEIFFTGRAPIEAIAQAIELGDDDWAIRCNLVTVADNKMKSFTAGQIPSAEAKELLKDFEDYLGQDELRFVPGVSYRNLLIADGSKKSIELSTIETSCTAPHDLTGKSISEGLPAGPGAEFLSAIMDASRKFFANHHVNVNRIKQGQLPATQVWLWGIGKRPRLDSFERKFGVRGSMITAVDLLRGLGHLLGWRIVEVPGATGYLDTDYAAKGRYAIEALGEADLVCVHIEAPDEASHEGDCENKIHSLEQIDRLIAAPLMEHLSTQPAWRILLSPDHPTFIRTQTHSRGFVPFTICGTGVGPDSHARYDEETASQSDLVFAKGHELMPRFINPTDSLEPKTES